MTAQDYLEEALKTAAAAPDRPVFAGEPQAGHVRTIARNVQNRAAVRLVLACALAKAVNPAVDARKPYTEIGGPDTFSGRTYDEVHIGPFVSKYKLPCNSTTAFLTPALRNRNSALVVGTPMVGRPPEVYDAAFALLDLVQRGAISAADLLTEITRQLLVLREEKAQRMKQLLQDIGTAAGSLPLASEAIVTLVEQHMALPYTSRLPVLVVAAAYAAAGALLGEEALPLANHNAADLQTGAVGDVEVVLAGEDRVRTGYEMKMKKVTQGDIDIAVEKIANQNLENYIFITTEPIDEEVAAYASSFYRGLGGVEVAILDCVSFLRHFLHLFHRHRSDFLDAYQALLLAEPDSAVSQALKEAWLTMRRAAEAPPAEA